MSTDEVQQVEQEADKTCIWCGGPVVWAEKWRKGTLVWSTLRCRWCMRQGGAL